MEVTDLTIWVARLGVLALMYLLVLVLVLALRADARAAVAPARQTPQPTTKPTPKTASTSAPSKTPTLVVTNGTPPTTGREYQLFGPLEIGRSTACNVTIPSKIVSSRHARVFSQNDRWMVEDLGSTNGTLLNGKPLTTVQPINPGDLLTIGDTEFTLR